MSAVRTTSYTWPWDTVKAAGTAPMSLPLAVQALIQNQVDQTLKELRARRWAEWQHEDFRDQDPSAKERRKKVLLETIPGMLVGPHARALRHEDWLPCYVLSAYIPPSRLRETSRHTDLLVCNVLWRHRCSRALSLTLYNNHLDVSATLSNFLLGHLSTNRDSQWAVGGHGQGFLRACHYIIGTYRISTGNNTPQLEMSLRVGNTSGVFSQDCSRTREGALVLRSQDLTPLSFKRVRGHEGHVYPFNYHYQLFSRTPPPSHISAIYAQRFLQCFSGSTSTTGLAMEPSHERPFVHSDEVVVTIYGLNGSLSPEYLFSGVYGIFPPAPDSTWTVPAQGQLSADIIFFLPPMNLTFPDNGGTPSVPERRGRFYYRDYLVPRGPSSHRLCINYGGDLLLDTRGMSVQTNNELYATYIRVLSTAIDTAIRTMPKLAVELAYEILTESGDLSYTFGRVLSPMWDTQDDHDAQQAYRTAFSKAWCRLDPTLATRNGFLYPYVAGSETSKDDRALIEQLGLHPVLVHAHVKALLERLGVCPPIGTFADRLLRSAPGVACIPPGVDVLKRCLSDLFPTLRGGPLSVRNYAYGFPRAVWDEEAQIFVVGSAACRCDILSHGPADDSLRRPEGRSLHAQSPCGCWIALVLREAVISWHTKNTAPGGSQPSMESLTADTEKRMFHVLYQSCHFPPLVEVPRESEPTRHNADDDLTSELEYLDAPSVSGAGIVLAQRDAPTSVSNSEPSTGQPSAGPSIPRRLARLALNAAPRQPLVGSSRISEEGFVNLPPSALQGYADLLKVVAAMGCSTDSVAAMVYQHYERETTSLREQLAQAVQESQRMKQESAELLRYLSNELYKSAAALRENENTIQAMEEKLRERGAVLEERNEEVAQKTARVHALERQVLDMGGEIRRLRRVNQEKFAQLNRVVQTLSRDESVAPDLTRTMMDDESGPPQKRARLDSQ